MRFGYMGGMSEICIDIEGWAARREAGRAARDAAEWQRNNPLKVLARKVGYGAWALAQRAATGLVVAGAWGVKNRQTLGRGSLAMLSVAGVLATGYSAAQNTVKLGGYDEVGITKLIYVPEVSSRLKLSSPIEVWSEVASRIPHLLPVAADYLGKPLFKPIISCRDVECVRLDQRAEAEVASAWVDMLSPTQQAWELELPQPPQTPQTQTKKVVSTSLTPVALAKKGGWVTQVNDMRPSQALKKSNFCFAFPQANGCEGR